MPFNYIELKPKILCHLVKLEGKVSAVEARVEPANVVGPPPCPNTIVKSDLV